MPETRDGRFSVTPTDLPPLTIIERRRREDDRGFLSRLYSTAIWAELGFDSPIVDINHTLTRRRGTVRGMHYQTEPSTEDKFVQVVRGSVYDVAVDLRRASPTFGRWHGETLSADNNRALLIPKGFAHGFQTLEDDCELLYFHTAAYDGDREGGVSPLDPALGIRWPLPTLHMSDRDRDFKPLTSDFPGITL